MTKPGKAQMVGEVFKYALVGVVSIFILAGGYKMIDAVKERACKTEIAKFEIDLKGIDKRLRFGEKRLQGYDVPCKADKIYFFDLSKSISPENFNDVPLLKDSLKTGGSSNVFVVKEGEVKRSFHSGSLEIVYPYYLCFTPKFDRISFFAEGAGKGAKITNACGQPECTLIPIDISHEDAVKIIKESIEFGCRSCPGDLSTELEKIKLTRDNVEMFRRFSVCEGITDIQIIIRPKKGSDVRDFRFYEFIPKTCIDDLDKYLAENIEGSVEVKGDPLIMWHFDNLAGEQKLSYRLNAVLDEGCMKAIQGLGVAQLVEEHEGEQAKSAGPKGANTAPVIRGLPDVAVSGAGLKKNVVRNIWKYAHDKETASKKLVYTIVDQTNQDLVECSISSDKHIDCDVRKNIDGISRVTIQVDDYGSTDRFAFDVKVSRFCKKRDEKACAGNSVFWLDSCGNREEFVKSCAAGEECKDGECKKP